MIKQIKIVHILKSVFYFLEVEKLLLDLETKQLKDFETKNLEGMVLHYHPDATLVHKGIKAFYGHDGLSKSQLTISFHF